MRELKVEIDNEARKRAPDDARLTKLRGEFEAAEAELNLHQAKVSEALLSGVDPVSGRPYKRERVVDRSLDDDPFGEPRSIPTTRTDSPWNLDQIMERTPVSELRARALSAVETMPGANHAVRETASKTIGRWDDQTGSLSRLAIASSDPDYWRAFVELARGGGNATLSEREIAALRRVEHERRAMSLSDSAGGYLVPFGLDPTVTITSDGSLNQIRRVARQVVATGDVWHGVAANETSWSWDAEAEEVSDDASTFTQPTIPVHRGTGFIPISGEAFADAANVTQEIGRLLAAGKDSLEAVAFTTGTGSSQPTGIVTALNSTASVVASAGSNVFGKTDIYALAESLPARHRNHPSAAWLANLAVYNDAREFETTNGASVFPEIAEGRLLGRPILEAEQMDDTWGSGENYVLVFGSFDRFVIADRIGTTVEFIPHLFGSNRRPTGQRGWWAYFRAGSDVTDTGAFRLLNVT
jgi:HK97 family phage major capsid protein